MFNRNYDGEEVKREEDKTDMRALSNFCEWIKEKLKTKDRQIKELYEKIEGLNKEINILKKYANDLSKEMGEIKNAISKTNDIKFRNMEEDTPEQYKVNYSGIKNLDELEFKFKALFDAISSISKTIKVKNPDNQNAGFIKAQIKRIVCEYYVNVLQSNNCELKSSINAIKSILPNQYQKLIIFGEGAENIIENSIKRISEYIKQINSSSFKYEVIWDNNERNSIAMSPSITIDGKTLIEAINWSPSMSR